MRPTRKARYLLLFLSLYLMFSAVAGIFVADGTLHPARRPLTQQDESTMRTIAHQLNSTLEDVSITTPDAVTLGAWTIHPHSTNGNAVILLHGLADNRIGMTGYAQLFLANGFIVLLPDARAHGARRTTRHLRPSRTPRHPPVVRLHHRTRSPPLHFRIRRINGRRRTPAISHRRAPLLRRSRRILILQLPRDCLRPHGPALSPRPLVRTHPLPPHRRIRFPPRSLEVPPRYAASLARRFGRNHHSPGPPDSRPDRQQHSTPPRPSHSGPQSKSNSLGSPQHRSLWSHQRSSTRIQPTPPSLVQREPATGTAYYPLITDHCFLHFLCNPCEQSLTRSPKKSLHRRPPNRTQALRAA